MPLMRSFALLCLFALFVAPSAWAAISLGGSTSDWTAISYGSNSSDYRTDQQTGHGDSDIVGDDVPGNQFGVYKAYDFGASAGVADDYIGFRFRVSQLSDYAKGEWNNRLLVGVDVGNNGSADVFIHVNGTKSKEEISYYKAIGPLTSAPNTSPSTTNIELIDAATADAGTYRFLRTTADADYDSFYNVSAVSAVTDHYVADQPSLATTDFNGDGIDQFVSFRVDMLTLIEAVRISTNVTLAEDTALMFLAATSVQANALNQDLAGQDGATDYRNSTDTWAALGAASDPYTASGESPVPEPATYALLFGLIAFGAAVVRRR
jgi:hypothetical protein